MESAGQLGQYGSLLRIRQDGRRRDARLSGAAFLISLLVTIGWGMVSEEPGRSLYILAGLMVALGLSFVRAWVRLEMINSTLELIGYLEREERGAEG
jgi:hypothetical protein